MDLMSDGIDQLLQKLVNNKDPHAMALMRGGGLKRGQGGLARRGGGLGRGSALPDGGYKKRPKAVRDEIERKQTTAVVQAADSDDDSDDDSVPDGDAVAVQKQPTAVLAGQNNSLTEAGGSPSKPNPQRVQQLKPSSAASAFPLSPNTSQMITKGLAGQNIGDDKGNRNQKYYFLRHRDNDDKQDWLFVGRGNEAVKTKMKTRSNTHLKAPYKGQRVQKKLGGKLDGHEMMMMAGEAGLFYKSKFRTLK